VGCSEGFSKRKKEKKSLQPRKKARASKRGENISLRGGGEKGEGASLKSQKKRGGRIFRPKSRSVCAHFREGGGGAKELPLGKRTVKRGFRAIQASYVGRGGVLIWGGGASSTQGEASRDAGRRGREGGSQFAHQEGVTI